MTGEKEYIIEFRLVGNAIKVSAVDSDSMTEVSIVGDPKRSREELTRLAVQKLEFVLEKKRKQKNKEE